MSRPTLLTAPSRDEARVSKIFRKQQYGFVQTDAGKDIFFMLKDCAEPVYIGDRVSYVIVEDRSHKGKLKAVQISKIGSEPLGLRTPGGTLLSPRVRELAKRSATRRKSVLANEIDPQDQEEEEAPKYRSMPFVDPQQDRIAALEAELEALKAQQAGKTSDPANGPAKSGRPSLLTLQTDIDLPTTAILSPRVRQVAAQARSRRLSMTESPRSAVSSDVDQPTSGPLTPRVREAARASREAKAKEKEAAIASFDLSQMHEGEVVQMVRDKFAFIMCNGTKIFFHLSDVIAPAEGEQYPVRIHCRVRFRAVEDKWNKGKLKAFEVCVVKPAPARWNTDRDQAPRGGNFSLAERRQAGQQRRQKQDEDWAAFLSSRKPSGAAAGAGGWRRGQRISPTKSAEVSIAGNTETATNEVWAKGPDKTLGFRLQRSARPSSILDGV